jgi:ferric-dicitrate binding protein FerR (iron transport regulator)
MKRFHQFILPVFPALFVISAFQFFCASPALAQEDDTRFLAVEVKGKVMIYRNQQDETGRFRTGQKCDDGDSIQTSSKSEVVLQLKNHGYVYLAPNTKVHISKLRRGDKGLQIRINLVKGRMLCQFEKAQTPPFEMSAGKLLCRAHGNLFEFIRKKEVVQVICFEGSIVASARGRVEMIKGQQLVKFDNGKFRYRIASLRSDVEGHLQAWKDRLKELQQNKPAKKS